MVSSLEPSESPNPSTLQREIPAATLPAASLILLALSSCTATPRLEEPINLQDPQGQEASFDPAQPAAEHGRGFEVLSFIFDRAIALALR